LNGTKYSALIHAMKNKGMMINRKMLADIAVRDPRTFAEIVLKAQEK